MLTNSVGQEFGQGAARRACLCPTGDGSQLGRLESWDCGRGAYMWPLQVMCFFVTWWEGSQGEHPETEGQGKLYRRLL